MDFQEADKKVHRVEDQWHYSILVAAGFVPITKEAVGLVRKYLYEKDGRQIECSTGAQAEYWVDKSTGEGGYWAELKPFLKGL
jgi:hypothetical protein